VRVCIAFKGCPQNVLYSVSRDGKPYSRTHSLSAYLCVCLKAFLHDEQGHVSGVKTVLVKWSKDSDGKWTFAEQPGLSFNTSLAFMISRTFTSVRTVDVAGCSVLLSDNIKVFGVTLDCHLSLDKYISSICKSAYYHIRSLRRIYSAMIWPNQSLLPWSALA